MFINVGIIRLCWAVVSLYLVNPRVALAVHLPLRPAVNPTTMMAKLILTVFLVLAML